MKTKTGIQSGQNTTVAYYEQRIAALTSTVDQLQLHDKRCSQIRGAAFLIATGMILGGFLRESSALLWLGFAAMAGFVALIYYHDSIQRRLATSTARRDINRHQVFRINRDWDRLPSSTQSPIEAIHKVDTHLAEALPPTLLDEGVTGDLDLFGPASLWQLANKAYTAFGQRILHDWFITPASPGEVKQRQTAIRRLAPMTEFREELGLHGRILASNQTDPAAFVSWAEEGRNGWTVVLGCDGQLESWQR